LAQIAVRTAKLQAAATGAATGAVSSPLTMLPAAIADIAAVLRIEANLAGTVAALLDPGALDNPDELKADVLSILFPSAMSQAIRQAGIQAGERLSQTVIRKYVSHELLGTLSRLVARSMGKQLTREALVRKAVPLVGMGIGAGWNWLEAQVIGTRAIRYYSQEAIGIAPARTRPLLAPKLKAAWPAIRRRLGSAVAGGR
jgi:hypothetical protein